MDNRVSLIRGLQFTKAKVMESCPIVVKKVKYPVGIALREIGFNGTTEAYVYKCSPYEIITASSFKNSYSKIRVAIPTIMDAATFLYNKIRMCFKIDKKVCGTTPTYKYSIGIVIPSVIPAEGMEFFPILEHKGYSYSIDDELTAALLKMCELVKKLKNGRL